MSKGKLYKRRIWNHEHNYVMSISHGYLSKKHLIDSRHHIVDKCKKFNAIVESWTDSIDFSVPLNISADQMAADFKFQYNRLLNYAEEIDCQKDVVMDLEKNGLITLFHSIVPKEKPPSVSLDAEILKDNLHKLIYGGTLAVLLYMKTKSQRQVQGYGFAEIIEDDISTELGITSESVNEAIQLLERHGLIMECGMGYDSTFYMFAL